MTAAYVSGNIHIALASTGQTLVAEFDAADESNAVALSNSPRQGGLFGVMSRWICGPNHARGPLKAHHENTRDKPTTHVDAKESRRRLFLILEVSSAITKESVKNVANRVSTSRKDGDDS
ncbi:hypothetical protein H9L39_01592 [Fusarium oxysporum f. sp. albedinis]|jgi:hypothetical protein|nr:hypothetical protein H9L39_01592 [Fusarium oxysporum f. sp. albedinis]